MKSGREKIPSTGKRFEVINSSTRFSSKITGSGQYLLFLTLIILLTALNFSGCSYNPDRQIRRIPVEMREVISLDLPFTPVKVAYSSLDNYLYIMEPETNLIRIYRDEVLVNTIGGLGFTESNFNRLSDITVSPHGRLLALDSFQRQIKKFDSNGMWLENYPLRNLNEPLLFDVSHDGMVFIFDRTSNEIVIFDERIEEVVFRFGKFLFLEPAQLISTFSHITVYDRQSDKTYIFDTFGKFLEELPGYWQIDRFNNKYRLEINRVSTPSAERDFHLYHKPWHSFFIKGTISGLITERGLKISEILYERD